MSKSEATTGAKLSGPRATPATPSSDASAQPGVGASPNATESAAASPNASGLAGASPSPGGPAVPGEPPPTPIQRMSTTRGHVVGGLHAALVSPGGPALTRLGRYHVIGRIATGGMAEVYLAVHGELAGFRTPVVLKKVLPHLACNPEFIDMFLDEARIASLLDHPNVVRIYEVGRSETEYFLAMELVQGKPLQALLRRAQETRTSVLEPRLAAFIVAQAASGLHHAHNLTDPLGNTLGLVHRDVSPQNILLSFEGSVKVIDFGVARALGRITETQTGGMKGKFGYMSPEQARGEDLDMRADIFALGVVLWESVTGRRLFQRDNDLATMRALIYDPIPKPSSVVPVAEGLESIVMRALTRDPAVRFQTARDLANALERYVVLAGGASASDLGAVMKSHFAQDYATWQQTIRAAVNLPAQAAERLQTVAPSTSPSAISAVIAPIRQRLPFAIAVAVALAAVITVVVMALRSPPVPTALPVPPAALARPSVEPPILPLPPVEAPFDPPPGPTAVVPSGAPSVARGPRKKPGSATRPSKGKPADSDRRPNPF